MSRFHVTTRAYGVTLVLLLALAGLSLILSDLPLGAWEMPAALAIAAVKAAMVLLVFMHLIEQSATSYVIVAVAIAFVALLIGLTATDAVYRVPPSLYRTERAVSTR